MDSQILLTILTIVAGGSGIGGIIVALSTRKKSRADAAKTIEDACAHLVDQYRLDNVDLRHKCDILTARIEELEGRVDENNVCQSNLEDRIKELEKENRELKTRIAELEKENKCLRDKRAANAQ